MVVSNQNKESWVHRVADEQADLAKKIEALRLFLGSAMVKTLPARSQADLKEQLSHMEGYDWVLQRRLRTANAN